MINFFILSFLSILMFNSYASLGRPVDLENIPESVCVVKIDKGPESFYCSGAMVSENIFKTAAHCMTKDLPMKVICANNEESRVKEVKSHKDFSSDLIKFETEQRAFDQAYLTLESEINIKPIRHTTSAKEINRILSLGKKCSFFGGGLNPWNEGTGQIHGVLTEANKVSLFSENLLVLNDPYGAVTMIGDSGASFLCQDENGHWVNIGTVSAHGWDHETYIAMNSSIGPDENLSYEKPKQLLKQKFKKSSYQIEVEVGQTYYLKPFSDYMINDTVMNNVDRVRSRIEVQKIEGDIVTGLLDLFSPSMYYLCYDAVSCETEKVNVSVNIKDLSIHPFQAEMIFVH